MKERVVNGVFTTIVIILCLLFSAVCVSIHYSVARDEVSSFNVAASSLTTPQFNLMEKATHILVGRVEEIESQWSKEASAIETLVKVNVEERLKGTFQSDHVVIKQRGGEVGDIGLWVSNEPSFLLGETVKVFLKLEENGEYSVLGGREGKISLDSPASLGFDYKGVHWNRSDLPVSFYVNQDGTNDVAGTVQEFQAVQNSFRTWEDEPGSFMDYTYMGTTTLFGESKDGYNVVSWQSIDGPEGTLAQTVYWYNPSNKLMTEFDIIFDEDEIWSATGEFGKHDIQNVGTHEVGHTLVLEDLYDLDDSEQTMYGYSSLGENKKRTLESGDIAGIRYIYPNPSPVYTITTDPSGLFIIVDGITYTAPHSFEWTPYSAHTISVPATQSGSVNTTRCVFAEWSDGGSLQHDIVVGTASLTITASYFTQYQAAIETKGLRSSYSAIISFTQLGVSKTSSTFGSWRDWCDLNSVLIVAQIVNGEDGERWATPDTTAWTVNSALNVTVNYVLQYSVSMIFKTYDYSVILQPTQVQILGGSPNNTLLTFKSYSKIWLENVTWTLKQVTWRQNNVAPNSTQVCLAPDHEWTITCRVYSISFNTAFKNNKGSALTENPSGFTLQFPNGTVSDLLNPSGSYYVQNGTTAWKSIIWQGVDVTPSDAYFDAAYGNPKINCLIYDFAIKVSDSFGFPVAGAQVSVELPNTLVVNVETGANGVALIPTAPKGEFKTSIHYLAQTVAFSGDVEEAALKPVEARVSIGMSVVILLCALCVLVVAVFGFLFLKRAKNKSMRLETEF